MKRIALNSDSPVFTQQLIAAVKVRPSLYDPSLHGYKNVHDKNLLWQEIAEEVGGASGATMSLKWKNLRDTYLKHKRSLFASADDANAKKWKGWLWAKFMDFLDPFMKTIKENPHTDSESPTIEKKKKLTREDENVNTRKQDPNRASDSDRQGISRKRHFVEDETSLNTKQEDSHKSLAVYQGHCKKKHVVDDEAFEYVEMPKQRQGEKLDIIDYLFLSYASTFKKLSPRRQALVKLEMAKLFANAELQEIIDPIKLEEPW